MAYEERVNLVRGRLIKTLAMGAFFAAAGSLFGIISPTTVDLVNLRSINYEELSRATTMRSVGFLLGVFLGAAISDRFRDKTDLFIAFGCLVAGGTSVALPWIPSLTIMGLMWGIQGVSYGSINVLSSSVVMSIWGRDHASTALSAIHAAYTIGILLAPPLVAPFLGSQNDNEQILRWVRNKTNERDGYLFNKELNNTGGGELPGDLHQYPYETTVHIPFAIAGGINLLVALVFSTFLSCSWNYTKMEKVLARTSLSESDDLEDKKTAAKMSAGNKHDLRFFVIFLLTIFLLFVVLIARDYSVVLYIFAMAVESSLNISKIVAAQINTTYNAGCALGRITSAVLVRFLPIQVIAMMQIVAAVTVSGILSAIGLDGIPQFWVLTFLHGFFCSPNNPTMMAWANRYIQCSGIVLAIIDAGIGAGGFIGTYISGLIFENHGSQGLLNFNLLMAGCAFVIVAPLQAYAHLHGERYLKIECSEKNNSNHEEPKTAAYNAPCTERTRLISNDARG